MINLAQPLVKIMSDSMATRIESEGFVQALVEVKTKLGLDATELATFVNNSAAARIVDPNFLPKYLLLPKITKDAIRSLYADIPIKNAGSNSPSR